jgi:hypothetical protein
LIAQARLLRATAASTRHNYINSFIAQQHNSLACF